MNGLFVVVEGPDGAGKSTLARGLADRLRAENLEVVEVREPGGTPAAELARQGAFDLGLDASDVAELFFVLAARADLVNKVIQPALERGEVVLSDRFDLSTEAYQIGGRGLPAEAVRNANALATGGLSPDVTIILDVPAELGRDRQVAAGKELDRMERESIELHRRVREVFVNASGPGIRHVDGSRDPGLVLEDAWAIVQEALRESAV